MLEQWSDTRSKFVEISESTNPCSIVQIPFWRRLMWFAFTAMLISSITSSSGSTNAAFFTSFFSNALDADRHKWHCIALRQTEGSDVVFLDPDNGLETRNMNRSGNATEKHVKWSELKDYYARGQNVILYQHRPQMTTKIQCIENVMEFQREYLQADCVMLLEFPKYTNRFYFMFLHEKYKSIFQKICTSMASKWSKNEFCREIVLE